jgi:hypothetical protein
MNRRSIEDKYNKGNTHTVDIHRHHDHLDKRANDIFSQFGMPRIDMGN